jgi:hypothetical protein
MFFDVLPVLDSLSVLSPVWTDWVLSADIIWSTSMY